MLRNVPESNGMLGEAAELDKKCRKVVKYVLDIQGKELYHSLSSRNETLNLKIIGTLKPVRV